MDDVEAILQLKQGDVQGLATLVDRYQERALYAAYLITHDRSLAEDIVQNAFLRVYERIEQFDLQRPFRPWFLKIVVNDAVKAVTRHNRQVSLEEHSAWAEIETLFDRELSPHTHAEHGELRQAVWNALQQLSPAHRAVVVQRYYLGFSEAEIATNLDCATGTIKSRLHYAHKRLRWLLRLFSSSEPL